MPAMEDERGVVQVASVPERRREHGVVQVYVRDAGQHVRAERDALRLPDERGEALDRERLTRGGAGDLGVRRKRIS